MKTTDTIELAHWARETVVPFVRARGQHHPASVDGPTHWQLETSNLRLIYAEQALLSSEERSLSCVLDVWAGNGAKILSLTWEPDRPWQPARMVRLASGPWREALERLVNTSR